MRTMQTTQDWRYVLIPPRLTVPEDTTLPGQDTSEVRSGHTFDVAKLEAYICQHIPRFHSPLTVRQFKIGQSNPTFLLQDGHGVKYVMRKKPPGKLIATAHMIEREYRVMKALRAADFPVPEMFVLCEDASVIGTPFYIMEFLTGRIFTDATLSDVPAKERIECWTALVKTLAQLHSIDFKKIGLEGFGKAGGFYTRQIARMRETSEQQVVPGKVPPLPYISELLKWYSEHMPPDVVTIVHGDYKFDNVIFHPTENRIIGVLDWEMSTIGHPLSDLANMLMPFWQPPPMDGIHAIEGTPAVDTVVKQYADLTKTAYPINGWKFAVSFALFRMGVILQGIGARSVRGQASNPMAEIIAEVAGPHAEAAFACIQPGGLPTSPSKL